MLGIWILEEGALEVYNDVDLGDESYKLKDICKVVDGSQVVAVKGTSKSSAVQFASCSDSWWGLVILPKSPCRIPKKRYIWLC